MRNFGWAAFRNISKLGLRRTFIVAILGLIVTVNFTVGEGKLLRPFFATPLGGPLVEEAGALPEEPAPPPPSASADTLTPVANLLGTPPTDDDSTIRFGDTIGGAVDPAGGLLEWVPENATVIRHVVLEGETIPDIARQYGVSSETILFANAISDPSTVRPGDTLEFPSISGTLHRVQSGETLAGIATAYGVTISRILAANAGISAASLEDGDELIIPGGRAAVLRGSVSAPSNTLGYFRMPTTGLNWGQLHYNNAVDIANVCGTPVWAAASGIVEWAAKDPNWYYGNYSIIRHPNGMRTYYTHLQTILVSVGAPVAQGEKIGTIGNTGRTIGVTGCHLHFEVRGEPGEPNPQNPFVRYR